MPLRNNLMVYIRFFTFMVPMFITIAAILESALKQNVKGILYITGALFTMLLGNLTSSSFPNRVDPTYDPACNMFDTGAGGWGTLYSSPGPHALFYAYTIVYMTLGMFINKNINWPIFTILIAFTILSAALRITAPMKCIKPIDLMIGYLGGILCGLAWYVAIYAAENSASPTLDLTYFGQASSDRETCSMEKNKAFRCTKVGKN